MEVVAEAAGACWQRYRWHLEKNATQKNDPDIVGLRVTTGIPGQWGRPIGRRMCLAAAKAADIEEREQPGGGGRAGVDAVCLAAAVRCAAVAHAHELSDPRAFGPIRSASVWPHQSHSLQISSQSQAVFASQIGGQRETHSRPRPSRAAAAASRRSCCRSRPAGTPGSSHPSGKCRHPQG